MLDGEPAIHPYRSLVVDGAEVQLEPIALSDLVEVELAAVPGDRVKSRVVHAGQTALGRVGHVDLGAEHVGTFEPQVSKPLVFIVEPERPGAAQIEPARTTELWARMDVR